MEVDCSRCVGGSGFYWNAVVSEVVGENVPVIDPHKAIIAAIIMMFVGLGIYLLRRKSYPAE